MIEPVVSVDATDVSGLPDDFKFVIVQPPNAVAIAMAKPQKAQ
jgi:hypothetical protein